LALRIIEAHVSPALRDDAEEILRESGHETWTEDGGRYGVVVRAVIGAGRTGEAMDRLHERLAQQAELLVLVQPLDGVLPRPLATRVEDARARARSAAAVSREEVYANVSDTARLSRTYLALVVLAAVVAGIGLARDNTAAVIGAMVVAPLLGPNMALALGMVLGDRALVRRALVTNAAGLAVGFGAAGLLGLALQADPATPELASRTRVEVWDLLLALAAGCAGALSYTTGVPTYLTGVMVSVALLPPAVASGILLAGGEPRGAVAAMLLAVANVTALTLASMLTFLARGLRPRNWWQEENARRSARVGIGIFLALFVVMAVLIVFARPFLAG
jgi:uncharacterized hydrophobic protein (TIGR00341 family)